MKTIMAPTNFSKESRHAVGYAADMAASLGADLLLLHVVNLEVSFDIPAEETDYDGMIKGAQLELAQLKKELLVRSENEITISTKVILGSLDLEIEELCKKENPFIVVIGAERKNLSGRLLLGSNTFNAIKNLHYPVLVVPPNANFKHIRRIGLAVDLQNIFELPLEMLEQLVEIFDASVDIIHVGKNKEDELKNRLRLLLLKERLRDFDPRIQYIIHDNIEDGLNEYALKNHEDLLVVVAREYRFPESLFHKSHSRLIARKAEIPVLTLAE